MDGQLQIDFWDGSKSLFNLAQFHFHAPSEHTVNGANYDLEMHMVHVYADESNHLGAVIGVFFDREAGGNYDNPMIAELLNVSKDWTNTTQGMKNGLSLLTFLSNLDFTKYWTYAGSLTTPPCTEGVKWTVLEEVQPISDNQLQQFTKLWSGKSSYAGGNGNNRVVQSLGSRTLYYNSSNAIAGIATAALAITGALMF